MEQLRAENLRAGGTIRPHRFVKFGVTENTLLECDAGDAAIGISDRVGSPPSVTAGIQALEGERLDYVLIGITDLLLGGAVDQGEYLVPDSEGRGVAYDPGSPAAVGARALEGGVSGDLVRVKLVDAGPLATGS